MVADDGVFVEKGGESHQGDAIAVPRRAETCADLHPLKRASTYLAEKQPRRMGNLWDSLRLPQQPSQ